MYKISMKFFFNDISLKYFLWNFYVFLFHEIYISFFHKISMKVFAMKFL